MVWVVSFFEDVVSVVSELHKRSCVITCDEAHLYTEALSAVSSG